MKTEDIPMDHKSTDKTEKSVGRRSVIGWFWKIIGALAILELGWITKSIMRSSHQANDSGEQRLVDVGMMEEFTPGSVTAVPEGQFHLVCLSDGSFLALSKSCTHLGCSVPWNEDERKFICPCHGSTFDLHGNVLTAPALRPLDYFPVLIENGLVRVDVSKPLRRTSFDPIQASRV
jgi:Rieske Fe-S protein